MSRLIEEQELLEATMHAMGDALTRNREKGGWRGEREDWLLERLEEEVVELRAEVEDALRAPSWERWKRVREEAADVANFAGMLIDISHERTLQQTRPPAGRWLQRMKLLEARASLAARVLSGRADYALPGGSEKG